MKKKLLLGLMFLGIFAVLSVVYASVTFARCDFPFANRQGCCSHHGGVCGCSHSGRAVCCDGSLSPSCGCN